MIKPPTPLTPEQEELVAIWEEHTRCEFESKDIDGTMATIAEHAHICNVPVMTGGNTRNEIREFYSTHFIPQLPADTETILISRTVGNTQIVDELVFKFTHDITMNWILPGILPTNKRVEVPLVVIIAFSEKKVTHEHIYWDQASVLVQLGLLDPNDLPVAGIESAYRIMNPESTPVNQLIQKAKK